MISMLSKLKENLNNEKSKNQRKGNNGSKNRFKRQERDTFDRANALCRLLLLNLKLLCCITILKI